jgi:hypothetical protein
MYTRHGPDLKSMAAAEREIVLARHDVLPTTLMAGCGSTIFGLTRPSAGAVEGNRRQKSQPEHVYILISKNFAQSTLGSVAGVFSI